MPDQRTIPGHDETADHEVVNPDDFDAYETDDEDTEDTEDSGDTGHNMTVPAETDAAGKVFIEIAGYRDPDGEVYIDTFANGQPAAVIREDIVDPGAGYPYPLSEWRRNIFDVGRGPGSPAWKRAMINNYHFAEDKYTENDMLPAQDREPEVTAVDQFTVERWIGDGKLILEPDNKAEIFANNTIRAGQALFAVQAYHAMRQRQNLLDGLRDPHRIAPVTSTQYAAAAAAVGAYAQLTAPNASVENLPNLVMDLLADMQHLADAKDVELAAPLDNSDGTTSDGTTSANTVHELQITMVSLRDDLLRAYPVWVGVTDELATSYNIDKIDITAYGRYMEEVTGDL
jgi:hypothetical protein